MKIDKIIFLNTLYQIVGKVITSGIGLLVTVMLTHYLGAIGFGEYSFVFNFVAFVVIFADFGLTTLLTREVANGRADQKYISYVFTLRLLLTSSALIVGSTIFLFLPYQPMLKIGVILASFANLFIFLSGPLWSIFQAKLQFQKIVIAQLVTAIINAIFIFLGIFASAPLIYFIGVNIAAAACGFLLSLYFSKLQTFLAYNAKQYIHIIKEAWPLGAGVLVSVAYFKIDSVILSFYFNPSLRPDVGYYAVAYKIFEVILVFGGFFTQTLYPFFSKNITQKSFTYNLRRFFLYTLALSLISSVGMFFFSPLLVMIIGGATFLPAITATQILSLSVGVSILNGFFLNICIAGNRQILLLKFAFAALLGNIAINFAVIPQSSFIGSSWTTLLTQTFVLCTTIFTAYLVVRKRPI